MEGHAIRSRAALIVVLVLLQQASPAVACKVAGEIESAVTLISRAEFIVVAEAQRYAKPPDSDVVTTGPAASTITFRIVDVLKGEPPKVLVLHGFLGERDDFNDQPVPYPMVRRNGRRGSCFANTYGRGRTFVLFLATRDGVVDLVPSPLAPVNEQVLKDGDPWVAYVRKLVVDRRGAGPS